MEGLILSYRRGRRTQNPRQFILVFEDADTREKARQLIGRKIKWVSPRGKEIFGYISNLHGNKNKLRSVFIKGLPGTAIGDKVMLVEG